MRVAGDLFRSSERSLDIATLVSRQATDLLVARSNVRRAPLNRLMLLVHYELHAQIDERHAEEFFAVIEPRWDDPVRRYFIEQGLELGAYAFDRLYLDLYALGKAAEGKGS